MVLSRPGEIRAYARTTVALVVKHRRLRHFPDVIRYAPRWFGTHSPDASAVADRQPWMVFRAIDALDRFLAPGMRVFEYGAGGSSAFFLDRGCELVSVEHDPAWMARLSVHLGDHPRWTLHKCPQDPDRGEDPTDPDLYGSHRGGHHETYVKTIDAYEAFEMVSVDGRARPAALRHAIPKVAPGGLLVLDNAERVNRYGRGMALVDAQGWKAEEFFGPGPYEPHFWATRVWHRSP